MWLNRFGWYQKALERRRNAERKDLREYWRSGCPVVGQNWLVPPDIRSRYCDATVRLISTRLQDLEDLRTFQLKSPVSSFLRTCRTRSRPSEVSNSCFGTSPLNALIGLSNHSRAFPLDSNTASAMRWRLPTITHLLTPSFEQLLITGNDY